MPTDHDYEPDTEAGAYRHGMETDPPCRICGGAKRDH